MLINSFFFFTFDVKLCNLFYFLGTVLSGEPFLFILSHLPLPIKIDLFIIIDDLKMSFLQLALEYSI